jgi:hypothetical protein
MDCSPTDDEMCRRLAKLEIAVSSGGPDKVRRMGSLVGPKKQRAPRA